MPTRKEVLMRSTNLLNNFAFKYVFGEDCKEANDALKSLLTVFLERKVNHVVVKNSEMVKDYSKMKNSRLDLLVEFDDQTTVDLEMQLRQTKDHLPNRFNYYLARLHGSQDMEGKSYSQLKETIVMIFFNLILVDDDEICSTFTMRKWSGIPFVKESEDCMKLITVEMPKVDLKKPLSDMNEQEKMIYYFLNCHKGIAEWAEDVLHQPPAQEGSVFVDPFHFEIGEVAHFSQWGFGGSDEALILIEIDEDIQLVADASVFRNVAGWKEDFSLISTIEIQTEIYFLYDAKAIVIAEFYLFCHIMLFSRI